MAADFGNWKNAGVGPKQVKGLRRAWMAGMIIQALRQIPEGER